MESLSKMGIYSRDKLRAALMKELDDVKNNCIPTDIPAGQNLVIGLAANYTQKDIYLFVTSLRGSGFTGDVVLFVTTLDEETTSFLETHHITAVRQWQSLFSYLNLQFARHVAYYDYLANLYRNGIRYERVFLADVRDVIFQEDPFRAIPNEPITFFLESDAITIGTCDANANWIASGFGEKELARLANKPVSCCGTVMGTGQSVMEYLLWMLIFSTLLQDDAVGTYGTDSSCHNMLVYSNLLSGQRIAVNGDGVLTLHHVAGRETVYVDADGFITSKHGDIYPVVHQYDRIEKLTERILDRCAGY